MIITQVNIEVLFIKYLIKNLSKHFCIVINSNYKALISEEQNGFRKGRSWMDCIFSASQIIEKQGI